MDKVIISLLALIIAIALNNCTKTIDNYCLIARPIYLSQQDVEVVSSAILREIVSHNEVWDSICAPK